MCVWPSSFDFKSVDAAFCEPCFSCFVPFSSPVCGSAAAWGQHLPVGAEEHECCLETLQNRIHCHKECYDFGMYSCML